MTLTESNQSGSEFAHLNQKCDNRCYREFLETQEDDAFELSWNMLSKEISALVKDLMLDFVSAVMDPNQLLEKVTSRMKVSLLANNWKSSNPLSCVESCFHAIGKSHIKEDEKMRMACDR